MSKTRSKLYGAARTLGNVEAVSSGKVPQRVLRVAAGRAYGSLSSGCLLPLLACAAFWLGVAYLIGGL